MLRARHQNRSKARLELVIRDTEARSCAGARRACMSRSMCAALPSSARRRKRRKGGGGTNAGCMRCSSTTVDPPPPQGVTVQRPSKLRMAPWRASRNSTVRARRSCSGAPGVTLCIRRDGRAPLPGAGGTPTAELSSRGSASCAQLLLPSAGALARPAAVHGHRVVCEWVEVLVHLVQSWRSVLRSKPEDIPAAVRRRRCAL